MVYLSDAHYVLLSLHEECLAIIKIFNGTILSVKLLIFLSQEIRMAAFWCGK
jgi:hypothetical protein